MQAMYGLLSVTPATGLNLYAKMKTGSASECKTKLTVTEAE